MKFTELDLRPELVSAIEKVGYAECTPIQELVIPQVLRGKDVSGLAQTGTGKTAAFVVPLIDRILRFRAGEPASERVPSHWKKNTYVLVLVPTRELATQVEESIGLFGREYGMRSVVVVGGNAYDDQKHALREGVEFVVGTPGRLLDLYKSHDLDLNSVGAVVFDEADRMFDMGFRDDMKFLLRRIPRNRQLLLFSATLNFEVLNTAYQFGAEPVEFNVSRDQVTAEGIDHHILHVGQHEKPMFLLSVIKKQNPAQGIIFSNFKHMVRPIARFLKENGYEAIEMSSLLSQHQRNKVLENFKSGRVKFLVATDVAARGLDIKGIDLVVNYDLPDDSEGYVHRIGRTGRAGGSGHAVGLVSDRDVEALQRIEEYLKEKLKIGWLDETDLVKEFKAFSTAEERSAPGPRFQRGGGAPTRARHTAGGRSGGRPMQRKSSSGGRGGSQQRGPESQHRPSSGTAAQSQTPSGHTTPTTQSPASQGHTTHGQTAQGSHSAVSSQHRDRRLGRHGGINFGDGSKTGENQNRNGRPSQARGPSRPGHGPNRGRQQNAQGGQGSSQRRPLRRDQAVSRQGRGSTAATRSSQASGSVGQKIKSFISKLFK